MPNAEASKILFFQQIVSESVRMFSLNRYQQSRCRCDDERLLEMCFDNFKHIKEHDIYYIIRSLSSEKLTQLYWHIRKKNICGTLDKFHGYCEDVFVYIVMVTLPTISSALSSHNWTGGSQCLKGWLKF